MVKEPRVPKVVLKKESMSDRATKPKETPKPIALNRPTIKRMTIGLIGESSLITHAWSEKAQRQMLDKQTKRSAPAKVAKDPKQDFLDSLYEIGKEKYGFPAVAFKSAAVDACSHVSGVTKVQARGAFHVEGEMVEITGSKPQMREDMVRIDMGRTADIRYRGEFMPWQVTLTLRYNSNVLSEEQIVNLFETAGFAIGVGEWRPQRNGSHGMFRVG